MYPRIDFHVVSLSFVQLYPLKTDYVDRQRQLPLCIKYHTLSSLYCQSENEQFFFPLYIRREYRNVSRI